MSMFRNIPRLSGQGSNLAMQIDNEHRLIEALKDAFPLPRQASDDQFDDRRMRKAVERERQGARVRYLTLIRAFQVAEPNIEIKLGERFGDISITWPE